MPQPSIMEGFSGRKSLNEHPPSLSRLPISSHPGAPALQHQPWERVQLLGSQLEKAARALSRLQCGGRQAFQVEGATRARREVESVREELRAVI